jgi:hypothetical protein
LSVGVTLYLIDELFYIDTQFVSLWKRKCGIVYLSVSRNAMRLLFILICFLTVSCSERKNTDLLLQPVSPDGRAHISTRPTDSSHFFSEKFWNYLTAHFESGSVELFFVCQMPYPLSLISDTAYCFSIVSNDNREKLLRYFPKDLSEPENKNYIEEQTLRIPEEDPDFKADVTKPAWESTPADIQNEYQRFYQLLVDKKHDQILVMKKSFYRAVLAGLRAPRLK